MPEIFFEIDDEGVRMIPAVYGTGADEAPATPLQSTDNPPAGQHLLDGDGLFKKGKG